MIHSAFSHDSTVYSVCAGKLKLSPPLKGLDDMIHDVLSHDSTVYCVCAGKLKVSVHMDFLSPFSYSR